MFEVKAWPLRMSVPGNAGNSEGLVAVQGFRVWGIRVSGSGFRVRSQECFRLLLGCSGDRILYLEVGPRV